MTEIMTWNYAGEADITYGEVHVSPVAKILLAISLIFIVVSAVSAIVFRDNIYDIIANPRIELLDTVKLSNAWGKKVVDAKIMQANGNYSVDIPYGCSNFDPEALISETNKKDYNIVKIDSKVDSSKLGTYKVKYISKNSALTNTTILTVNVKDMTGPEIHFKKNPIVLVSGVENHDNIFGTESFKNAEDFIDYKKDDCSDPNSIKLAHDAGEIIDFDSEGTTIHYTATDEAGNSTSESLSIIVVNNYEEVQNALNRTQKELNEYKDAIPSTGSSNNSSGNKSNTATSGQFTFSAAPVTWSESQSEPLEIVLREGITYNGNGTAYLVDGPGITSQLDGPGVYNYTWKCDEGSTIIQQVTITE